MKIFGFTKDVVDFMLSKIEIHIPHIEASSISDFQERYAEEAIKLIEDSLSFFKIDEEFKGFLSIKAKNYAEEHYYDELKNCFFELKENTDIGEVLKVIQSGKTMEWLKENNLEDWITSKIKNKYNSGEIQHRAELILLHRCEFILRHQWYSNEKVSS